MNVLPGAHCVITTANIAEDVCTVHTAYAPCPHDSEPASTAVIHADAYPSRDAVLAYWRQITDEQRTLVIHAGDLAGGRGHDIGENDVTCWCRPEVLFARQLRAA